MSPLLISAIVIITLALVFYSIGVIGEARRKNLLWKDVIWFGLGLAADFICLLLLDAPCFNYRRKTIKHSQYFLIR